MLTLKSFGFLSTSLLAIFAVGCGSSGETFKLIPVEGVVKLDSKPVADALVQFNPSSGPSSQGYTDAQGKFTLETQAGKGAVSGSHMVKVTTGLPRPVETNSKSATDTPTEVTLTATPPVDYQFESGVNVDPAANSVELDLNKAKKRRG